MSKVEWQRSQRRAFASVHGFSTTANYSTNRNRESVLTRDGYQCVVCGMSDELHREIWDRPITIDHKNKNRLDNRLCNLQTMCLRCHGRKDISAKLIVPKVSKHKTAILAMRADGETYQEIADHFNFSIGAVWKWCQLWKQENA